MAFGPTRIAHDCRFDLLIVFALDQDRYGQPGQTLTCPDAVPITPVAAGELHLVIEHQLID